MDDDAVIVSAVRRPVGCVSRPGQAAIIRNAA